MPPRYDNKDLAILRVFSEAIKASDTEAYEVLFRAEFENVKYFIQHYLHDNAEAEDLAQEAFAALWTNRDRIDPQRNIRSFLFTIARQSAQPPEFPPDPAHRSFGKSVREPVDREFGQRSHHLAHRRDGHEADHRSRL